MNGDGALVGCGAVGDLHRFVSHLANGGERDAGNGDRQSEKAKSRPATQLSDLGVTKTQSSRWQRLAGLADDEFEVRVEHANARIAGMTTSAPSYSKAEYTGENESFTPDNWIAMARQTLGEIDLDLARTSPAPCAKTI
jgi:hypothetical protein